MTQDEIKALELEALIEDLRLNHVCCPKEVILQAADELERLSQTEQEPVQVSPLEFVEMVMEKEHLIGKPIFWAEWPNKEKNNA
jgi:hypothetical protein